MIAIDYMVQAMLFVWFALPVTIWLLGEPR